MLLSIVHIHMSSKQLIGGERRSTFQTITFHVLICRHKFSLLLVDLLVTVSSCYCIWNIVEQTCSSVICLVCETVKSWNVRRASLVTFYVSFAAAHSDITWIGHQLVHIFVFLTFVILYGNQVHLLSLHYLLLSFLWNRCIHNSL